MDSVPGLQIGMLLPLATSFELGAEIQGTDAYRNSDEPPNGIRFSRSREAAVGWLQ